MPRKVVTITHPDGTKKVIVGKEYESKPISSNNTSIKTREIKEEDNRAKPGTPKVGLTKERNGYKCGGKIKFKSR